MQKINLGFAICGSFCTFSKILDVIDKIDKEKYNIFPIFSENAYNTKTRFIDNEVMIEMVENYCGKKAISTIKDAEPIGPKNFLDALVIAPCTGNTIAKIAHSITDSTVTLATKAILRNNKPVIIAVSTNDALSANAKNIGALLNTKNIYFVPMKQDDPINKPRSIVCDFDFIDKTIDNALNNIQIQPIYL